VFNRQIFNLAQLIESAASRSPNAQFGVDQCYRPLAEALEVAKKLAVRYGSLGLNRGDCIAFIGPTTEHYLICWLGAQMRGLQTALINPYYPEELIREMLADLRPRAALTFDASTLTEEADWLRLDGSRAWQGEIGCTSGERRTVASEALSGTDCDEAEIACFMHTSGTSGRPKFCALSHAYFLRLGRFIADSLGYVKGDVVYAPMPMFHINPLGYGVVAALTANAGVVGAQRFKAEEFWDTVKRINATAVILHATPTKLLLRNATKEQSAGHQVRVAYFAGPDFLDKFDVPLGMSAYGSTEAGGLCHLWLNRVGDDPLAEEGALHYAGRARFDVEAKISDAGEILVRGSSSNTLFSGYLRNGSLDPSVDEDGWFHTGDRGRLDVHGNLVFIERASESIRVNGEYVPIEYVEKRLETALGNTEFAIGARPDPISGQRVVLFVAESEFDTDRLCTEIAALPKLMQPVQIRVIRALPRDTGVNKVQRRRLDDEVVLREIDLSA